MGYGSIMAHAYRATVTLDCPAEVAWETLVDFAAYPEWNPFTPRVRCALEVGTPVVMRVRLGGVTIIARERLTRLEPPHAIAWSLRGPRAILWAERTQTLTPLPDGSCRYETVDVIEGVLSGLVDVLFGRALDQGFERVAAALAERVRA